MLEGQRLFLLSVMVEDERGSNIGEWSEMDCCCRDEKMPHTEREEKDFLRTRKHSFRTP